MIHLSVTSENIILCFIFYENINVNVISSQ